ncbi:MAG: class I SAM-dependent methyltransferase [Phycisphaerales bacterium]|nr:class I SAM-dependent methyltransferase [Phycisphaerales bacterium]
MSDHRTTPAELDARLHDMNPTGRFSDRVGDYVKFRPTYPSSAIDWILDGMGAARNLIAADIGAGTGISARLLADRGVRVLAIEPNADMRAGAEPHPLVEWRDGAAEATGLDSASVDLVLCAQAFHWFRPQESLGEFHRILRDRGRLALVWNQRDAHDPVTMEYTAAIREASGESRAERMPFDPGVAAGSGRFTPVVLNAFSHSQRLTREGLIGRATSASYAPKAGPLFDRLVARLEGMHKAHADADAMVELRYVTQVFISVSK